MLGKEVEKLWEWSINIGGGLVIILLKSRFSQGHLGHGKTSLLTELLQLAFLGIKGLQNLHHPAALDTLFIVITTTTTTTIPFGRKMHSINFKKH